jgi:hypothetical protein
MISEEALSHSRDMFPSASMIKRNVADEDKISQNDSFKIKNRIHILFIDPSDSSSLESINHIRSDYLYIFFHKDKNSVAPVIDIIRKGLNSLDGKLRYSISFVDFYNACDIITDIAYISKMEEDNYIYINCYCSNYPVVTVAATTAALYFSTNLYQFNKKTQTVEKILFPRVEFILPSQQAISLLYPIYKSYLEYNMKRSTLEPFFIKKFECLEILQKIEGSKINGRDGKNRGRLQHSYLNELIKLEYLEQNTDKHILTITERGKEAACIFSMWFGINDIYKI